MVECGLLDLVEKLSAVLSLVSIASLPGEYILGHVHPSTHTFTRFCSFL